MALKDTACTLTLTFLLLSVNAMLIFLHFSLPMIAAIIIVHMTIKTSTLEPLPNLTPPPELTPPPPKMTEQSSGISPKIIFCSLISKRRHQTPS